MDKTKKYVEEFKEVIGEKILEGLKGGIEPPVVVMVLADALAMVIKPAVENEKEENEKFMTTAMNFWDELRNNYSNALQHCAIASILTFYTAATVFLVFMESEGEEAFKIFDELFG